MTTAEREHWHRVTEDEDWKVRHIADPNISLTDTLEAITNDWPANPRAIVEIGCGYGRLATKIAAAYPDAEVFGIDISETILEHALPGFHPMWTDSLCGFRVDVIYSVAVFQHIPDAEKRRYIREAYMALRRGGMLRIQFIAGVRDNHLDHWTDQTTMLEWFDTAGFKAIMMETGLVHPQWSWITGIK